MQNILNFHISLIKFLSLFKNNYRTVFVVIFLMLVFYFSKHESYLLFHTFVELFSIVVAFAVFIVTWNSRNMQDNKYLHLVGISYLFIGALDLLHTISYKGMNIFTATHLSQHGFPANQFWVATRFLEAFTLLVGFLLVKRRKALNSDLIFLAYFCISGLIILSILVWHIFPVCFIEGQGQTDFKVYSEYVIITILFLAGILLVKKKRHFSRPVFQLLLTSIIFTILSEFCFTLYVSNYSTANEFGHYAKLIAFFLIYKANVETGFINPTDLIFKNLKDSEEKYRTLAENLPAIVLRFDHNLNCIYSNSAHQQEIVFEGQDHFPEAVGTGRTLQDMLVPVIHKSRQIGLVQQTSFQIEMPSASQFYAVQVIPEYTAQTEESSYLVICQDVTELKRTEQQLHSLNETKDKLFSIIAHDLKNPFTSLLSYSELISRNSEKLERPKIKHMAGRMNESAKQAYALLENLLNWSRIQTGMLKPVPEEIDINELFLEARQLAEPLAQSKGIGLTFSLVEDTLVLADRQMTATVLRNLISNALKFSYQGSGVLIGAERQGGNVLFSIKDSGIGIAEEHRKQLLQIGNKFSAPGTAAELGTGLGLVLCREFIEINGGEIWLESEFGIGTTFYFTLPAA